MNTFFALTIVALALASCNALVFKETVDFCNDDQDLTAAEIAIVTKNNLNTDNKNVKGWTWCYYTKLNIFDRLSDFSESASRASFIAHYPTKAFTGANQIAACNAQAKSQKDLNEKYWSFHKCLVNNGFKV